MRASDTFRIPSFARWAPAARALGVVLTLLAPARAGAESIVVRWTAPGDDGNTGRASTYEMRFSESPIASADTTSWWSAAAIAGALPAPQSAGIRESFTVSGLDSGKTYYFVIRTADEVPNWSGFSNVSARAVGGSGSGLPTPSAFAAALVPGGVALTWQEVPAGSGTGYRVYRAIGSPSIGTVVHTGPLTETAWTDTTVVGGTTYTYSIVTYSGSTESAPASAIISVPPDELQASTPTLVGYPNPSSGPVTFRFRAGTAEGAPGRSRLVIYDLSGHRICVLFDETIPAGEKAVAWDRKSETGTPVAPGLYNAILDTPLGRKVTRVALVP
jgi:hypothetical protein